MLIKADMQGVLIYVAMAVSVLAMIIVRKRPKPGRLLFALAFVINVIAVVYRGFVVRHVPLQNMFEVFLFLGCCVGPIHWLSGRLLRRHDPSLLVIDAVIGVVVLFPAGFVFPHDRQFLPPVLQCWMFGPHVAAYMLAYIFMTKAAVFAAGGLIVERGNEKVQATLAQFSYLLVAAGFPLLTLGLFLGSAWGKYAWGDWWGWDPKELWSLVCWLVYLLYLHYRCAKPKAFRAQHGLVLLGLACILITLLWVNLSKIFAGLHSYAA